ncbi:hypothetical protein C8Q80DRAFT_949224 [Daedaleopsis nitida]|nr:hypothetical protein C8Q80DRAFT_949224 [Daedaleopsis nitida]
MSVQGDTASNPWTPMGWKVPDTKNRWRQRMDEYTAQDAGDSWANTADVVKTYSDEMMARWDGEIDTLLVFAALLSAIVSAFTVESYQLLAPSSPDPVLATLQQISTQLNSFSINPPFVNSTHVAAYPTNPDASPPPRWAIWLNALWFLSLVISISSATIGIMVKQWLNAYKSGLWGTSRQIAQLRQYRLNGLKKWHVADIVALLPVLLEISLALFLAGIVVFLWVLHRAIAIPATIVVGLLLVSVFTTVVLPAFASDCCYLSPPAFTFNYVLSSISRSARAAMRMARGLILGHGEGEEKLGTEKGRNPGSMSFMSTVRGRELVAVARNSLQLDFDAALTAYTVSLDLSTFGLVTPGLMELGISGSVKYLKAMMAEMQRHDIVGKELVPAYHQYPNTWSTALLVHVAALSEPGPDRAECDEAWREQWELYVQFLEASRVPPHNQGANILVMNLTTAIAEAEQRGVDVGSAFEALRFKVRRMDSRDRRLDERSQMCLAVTAERQALRYAADTGQQDKFLGALEVLLRALPPAKPTGHRAQAIRSSALHGLSVFERMLRAHASTEVAGPGSGYHPHPPEALLVAIRHAIGALRLRERAHVAELLSPGFTNALARFCDGLPEDGKMVVGLEDVSWIRRTKSGLTP